MARETFIAILEWMLIRLLPALILGFFAGLCWEWLFLHLGSHWQWGTVANSTLWFSITAYQLLGLSE